MSNNKKKKVLFVGSFKNSTKDGGVGGQMYASKTLINSTLNVFVEFILIDSTADSIPAPVFYKRLFKALSRLLKLFQTLLAQRPFAVMIFSSSGWSLVEKGLFILISKKLFRKRTIFAPRSGLVIDDYSNHLFFRKLIPLIIRNSDFLICQGTYWEKFYKKITPGNTSTVFIIQPNWIDLSKYLPLKKTKKKTEIINILYLGWIEEYKGILDFLSALEKLNVYSTKIVVDIYGNGSLFGQAQSIIKELNLSEYVNLKGWADQNTKLEALKKADIYILPSHAEGFPNALIEAMAAGTAVVACNVGGVSDVVVTDETGILIEPKDIVAMAKGLETLINNEALRDKVAREGQKFIIENNRIEKVADNLRSIFE